MGKRTERQDARRAAGMVAWPVCRFILFLFYFILFSWIDGEREGFEKILAGRNDREMKQERDPSSLALSSFFFFFFGC